MTIRKITLIFGILMANLLFAQRSKESLQKQRAELQKQIANINSELAKTKDEAKLSISYLNNINKKLSLREQVYNNTQKEKRVIEDDIYTRQLEINKLNRELKVLRENYSQTLVNAYKNKGVQNKVTFILSSKNIGEALRRVQYLKKYSEYQDKKAKEIGAKTEQIKKTIALREKAKKDKENLLIKQNQELTTIAQERKEKEILLEEFKKNETKLVAELNQKQAESRRLKGEIRRIIAEELRIAKAKEEAERKAREEKLRLARIEAEKEKKRIEEANRKAREEAERARRKAEEEERKLAELARKKAEEERKAIEAAKEAQRIAEERAKQEANERARQAAEKARLAAEKARLEAEKARQEAAEKARLAAEKAEAARESSQTVAKKIETEKKEIEQKVENTYSVGTATGSNFASNRGRMMFPVSRGQVSQRFGRQAHPVYKGVVIENNGIKITVGAGTQARSIFAGTVVNIISNGGTRTVMVKHGDYFSIYGNLSSTSVSKNQVITAGTSIGEVGLDFDGTHTLDFQIWDKTTPVDPLSWVSR